MSSEQPDEIVRDLATRPGCETVRSDVRQWPFDSHAAPGAQGPKDLKLVIWELPIAEFNPVHAALADAAHRAQTVAA